MNSGADRHVQIAQPIPEGDSPAVIDVLADDETHQRIVILRDNYVKDRIADVVKPRAGLTLAYGSLWRPQPNAGTLARRITCMRFDITPLVGVGPVLLGVRRADVRNVMSEPLREFFKGTGARHATDAFHNSAFQVHYSGDLPIVEFIELCRGGEIEACFDGIDLFALDATTVVARVTEQHAFDERDPELGYAYVFPDLELALWRPHIPDDESDDGRFFSTVGIGRRGYFTKHHD